MQTLERLAQFRQALYQTGTHRAAALLEVIDAVAQVPRPHSPAELSLAMPRHWSSRYDARDAGRLGPDAVRPLLAELAGLVSPSGVSGQAEYLVTGDTKLQNLGSYQGVTTLNPEASLDLLWAH